MYSKSHADRVSGGVFFIGLALLFLTGYWWPGILFVIGASSVARGMAEGQPWYATGGGVWMLALGVVFMLGFRWELLLIFVGLSMLFGYKFQSGRDDDEYYDEYVEKPKHEGDEI